MPSTWTYNVTDPADQVAEIRLQLADTDFTNVGDSVPRAQQTALFSDQEYQRFLAMTPMPGDTTVALVRALLSIANNRAIMAVAVNLGGGGSVDFGKLASDLRAQAQAIYDWYCSVPAESFSEVDGSAFAAARITWNQLMRQSA